MSQTPTNQGETLRLRMLAQTLRNEIAMAESDLALCQSHLQQVKTLVDHVLEDKGMDPDSTASTDTTPTLEI